MEYTRKCENCDEKLITFDISQFTCDDRIEENE